MAFGWARRARSMADGRPNCHISTRAAPIWFELACPRGLLDGVGQQKLALLAGLGELAEELRAGSVKGDHGVETAITDRLCGRALGQDGSGVARDQGGDGRASAT